MPINIYLLTLYLILSKHLCLCEISNFECWRNVFIQEYDWLTTDYQFLVAAIASKCCETLDIHCNFVYSKDILVYILLCQLCGHHGLRGIFLLWEIDVTWDSHHTNVRCVWIYKFRVLFQEETSDLLIIANINKFLIEVKNVYRPHLFSTGFVWCSPNLIMHWKTDIANSYP